MILYALIFTFFTIHISKLVVSFVSMNFGMHLLSCSFREKLDFELPDAKSINPVEFIKRCVTFWNLTRVPCLI